MSPLTLLTLSLALGAAEKPRLAVLDLNAAGVAPATVTSVQEAMTAQLAKRGFFSVISATDIRAMLGVERQRQLLGCNDESACTAEIANALGSRFVLSGTLSKLGDALQLSLQMLDTQKGQPVGRATRLADTERALVGMLPWALAEATATPAPPKPSVVLPWTCIGLGAASLAVGGILGVTALTRDGALTREFSEPNASLKSLATYREEAASVGLLKTVSLATLVSGAALLTLGAFLFPPDTGGAVALVPLPSGLAFAGVWP